MIEMSCPRCGAGGRVPSNKTNARLVCKKCLQVFHLTAGGQAVLGEPPPPKDAPRTRVPRERIEFDPAEMFGGVGQKLSRFRLPDLKILSIVGLILLVLAAGYWLMSRESVEMRSQRLATAITRGDMQAIVDLSLPGMEMDAMKWAVDVIKEFGELKLSLGGYDPAMQVQVQRDTQGSSAHALVVFAAERARRGGSLPLEDLQPVPSLAGAKKSVEVVLYWTPDTWGNWRLDAKRTAGAAVPAS